VAPSPAALSPSMETRALPGPSGASGDSPNQLQKLQVDMPAQYRNRARVRRDSVCATDTLLMPPPANLCRAVSAPQQQLDSADVSSMEHEDDASSPAVSSISLSTSYGSMDSAMLDVSGLEDSKFSPWSIHSADPVSQCSQTSSSSSMSAGPYHTIARHAVHPAVLQLAHPQPQSNYPVLPQLPEVSSKPADDLAFIQMHVFDHVMFRDLTSFQKRAIFEALRQVKVQAGHYVCRQGTLCWRVDRKALSYRGRVWWLVMVVLTPVILTAMASRVLCRRDWRRVLPDRVWYSRGVEVQWIHGIPAQGVRLQAQ